MSISVIIGEISELSNKSANFKPHKLIMLLSVVNLFEDNAICDNKIFYNDRLLEAFTKNFSQYAHEGDRDRPHAPFFHLRSSYLWELHPRLGKTDLLHATSSVGGPGKLNELVEYAVLSKEFYELLTNESTRRKIKAHIIAILENDTHNSALENVMQPNKFVFYINSLNCIDAYSDGALAERQAKEPLFGKIQVPHPLVDRFYEALTIQENRSHIILTGHAGDGKSTIALELYRRLQGIATDSPLADGLPPTIDLECNGVAITLIKDLSECSRDEKRRILESMLANRRRYFLISNTGCLLNFFKKYAEELGCTPVEMEGKLLSAMDSSRPSKLELTSLSAEINNLAMIENIDLAMRLWDNLTTTDEWAICKECPVNASCPIYGNISIIQTYSKRIRERLRLLLKRTYEYGDRLTMRQLSGHFSYMISAGLDCSGVASAIASGKSFTLSNFLFANRCFGDAGGTPDVKARQLKSVSIINGQGFGMLQAPGLERYIWLNSESAAFNPGIPELSEEYKKLRKRAISPESTSNGARKQIRRIIYFLHEPSSRNSDVVNAFEAFKSSFLNSPMLLECEKWQNDASCFSRNRSNLLEQIFPVLQEQFCGVRLPEGASQTGKNLYITLSRRRRDIRQSAQIVLGEIKFGSVFDLQLSETETGQKILSLAGKGVCNGISMELPLPFLDYIAQRKAGGIGNILQLSYVDRLENLKNQILARTGIAQESDMLLLKQDAKRQLLQQRLRLEHGRLEVTNG